MTIATAAAPQPAPLPVYRFTVEQYHRMIRGGILTEDDEVELLNGVIVPKMSKGKDHETAIEKLTRLLARLLPDELSFRCQCAVSFPGSAPEPDFVICPPPEARQGENPGPAETFLVIEVTDTTSSRDHGEKFRMYAEVGIAVYWIVNLVTRVVEVYTHPFTRPGAPPSYATRTDYQLGQQVPVVVTGTAVGTISVDALLP